MRFNDLLGGFTETGRLLLMLLRCATLNGRGRPVHLEADRESRPYLA